MTPSLRTPQQRDRRFARIRRLAQVIFLGSGAVSAAFVGYTAAITKPVATVPVTVATSTPSATSTTVAPTTKSTGATPTTVPTTVPVTTTTVCYSTPSGHVTCY